MRGDLFLFHFLSFRRSDGSPSVAVCVSGGSRGPLFIREHWLHMYIRIAINENKVKRKGVNRTMSPQDVCSHLEMKSRVLLESLSSIFSTMSLKNDFSNHVHVCLHKRRVLFVVIYQKLTWTQTFSSHDIVYRRFASDRQRLNAQNY